MTILHRLRMVFNGDLYIIISVIRQKGMVGTKENILGQRIGIEWMLLNHNESYENKYLIVRSNARLYISFSSNTMLIAMKFT